MVVCKYFLQGTCRFGSNCNYEHPRDQTNHGANSNNQFRYRSAPSSNSNLNTQSNYNTNQNQYRYVANQQQQQHSQAQPNKFSSLVSRSNQPGPTIDQDSISNSQEFLEFIRNDLSLWLNSSAWKLSCYSYKKNAPCMSILEDLSPEEVRYTMYEAQKKNLLNQAIQEFQQKQNNVTETIKQLINPNQQAKEYLIKYYEETENLIKKKSNVKTEAPLNPFMQIVQQKQIEQQKQQYQPTPFIKSFNQPAQQSSFQQNLFQTSSMQQQSQQMQSFQQIQSQQMNNNFQQGAAPNLFSQVISQKPTTNGFQHTASTSQTNFFQQTNNINPSSTFSLGNINNTAQNSNIRVGNQINNGQAIQSIALSNLTNYSSLNDLSEQEMTEFNSNQFTMGKIPKNPPPQNLC